MKKSLLFLIVFAAGSMPLLAQPTITQQPTNQVLALGATLTLSVTTSDPLAGYQWFKDNRLILGATNSTLTVTNAGAAETGAYFVVATNGSGMVISVPALVAVGNPVLLAWGKNQSYGQLGDGTTANKTMPEVIIGNAVTATAGGFLSLLVTADSTVWGMGRSFNTMPTSVASNVVAVAAGMLSSLFAKGDGTLWTASSSPTPISGVSNVVAVAGGNPQFLFLKSDGTLWTANSSPTPISGASNVVVVAAGAQHTLFLKSDGTLWAMGNNQYGQLGDGTTMTQPNPVPVIGGSNVMAVAAGFQHSLFLKSDGTLWAMGNNQYGQLGDGTTTMRTNPVPVIGGTNVVALAAGHYHSLFMRSDGTLWAMGNNSSGQLGNGTTVNQATPVSVATGAISLAGVYSGNAADHSFAIGQPSPQPPSVTTQATMPVTATNALLNGMALPNGLPTTAWFEWGLRGSFTQTTSPVNIGSGNTVVRVSTLISGLNSGNVYQCSLVASNSAGVATGAVQWFRVDNAPKVAAWGYNSSGQSQVPQDLTNVIEVAAGGYHSLALEADGTVRHWGQDPSIPSSATNVVALGTDHLDPQSRLEK